jgi:catechol 2,3-dioxygenase
METVTGHVPISEPVAGERRHVLPDALRLGAAHLMVAELDRGIAFYEHVVGLRLRERGADVDGATASLSAGGAADVVVLHERSGAHAVRRHSGLYHVALLYPSQLELARVAQRIAERQAPIQGASDHGTHEAIYLADPDGNGLELAADRPRDRWPDISNIDAIAPQPLDMGNLFNITSGRAVAPHADPATAVGHVHLHVGDIGEGLAFYRDMIGFDLVARIDSAAFVSAGGYHHHLAFNIWQGHGAPPSPPDATGLDHWTVELPAAEDVRAVRARLAAAGHDVTAIDGGFVVDDPWSITLHVIKQR